MTDVMDLAIKEAKKEAMEKERMDKFYARMEFQNLVRRAEFMGDVPARKRLSQQIAESVIESHGAFAHLYALEKLERPTKEGVDTAPLWRDVLTWIDELTGEENASN
jgi:hypothetical protein